MREHDEAIHPKRCVSPVSCHGLLRRTRNDVVAYTFGSITGLCSVEERLCDAPARFLPLF